jgi:hypothetical protein
MLSFSAIAIAPQLSLSLSLSLSLNSHTTDVRSPRDRNQKRRQLCMPHLSNLHLPSNPNPNPNPNFNGYDLNTVPMFSDGLDRKNRRVGDSLAGYLHIPPFYHTHQKLS